MILRIYLAKLGGCHLKSSMILKRLALLLSASFLWLAAILPSNSQQLEESSFLDFRDPRQFGYCYEWISDGEEKNANDLRSLSHSILIVCWSPSPEGEFRSYQISGIDGYHSAETVESFLRALYAKEVPKTAYGRLNVIVSGNNWGAGKELGPCLKDLSKAHKFSVFYIGGWAFTKARLQEEPADRLKYIRSAFEAIQSPEQKQVTKPDLPKAPIPDIRDGVWTISLRYWAHQAFVDSGVSDFRFLCEVTQLGPEPEKEQVLPLTFRSGELKVLENLSADEAAFKTLKSLRVTGCEGLELGDKLIVFVDEEAYQGSYVINLHDETNSTLGHRFTRKAESQYDERHKKDLQLVELLRKGEIDVAKVSAEDLRTLSFMNPDGVREALIREREVRELREEKLKLSE
ncbi:hypothetical protein N9891_00545 [bacterium]|nr:hypothetical protein [bacterium]